MALRFPFASVPYVLRSSQKDDTYAKRLHDALQTALTVVMGGRFTSQHDELITAASEALYYYCSLAITSQTLGEEYTELLPVSASGRTFKGWWTLLHIVARILVPMVLRRLVSKLVPNVTPSTVVHHVNLFHMGVFFVWGAFPTLAHRVSRMRYLALSKAGAEELGQDGRRPWNMYAVLGVLLITQELIQLYQWYQARRAEQAEEARRNMTAAPATASVSGGHVLGHGSDARGIGADTVQADSDGVDDGVDRGTCTLCLCEREKPAATRCGHVFCWECIMRWYETSNQGQPICPNCRQPAPPQSVVLLANYAVHGSGSTGGGEGGGGGPPMPPS